MLSIKVTGEDCYRSTYNTLFKKSHLDTKKKTLKEKFSTFSGQTDDDLYIEKPAGKKSGPTYYRSRTYPCLGLGCFSDVPLFNTKKPIVRDVAPHNQKFDVNSNGTLSSTTDDRDPMEKSLEELITNYTWTTTTDKEQKQYCMPIPKFEIPSTTLEKNADQVRCRTRWYEDEINDWQIVGRSWDRVQLRKNYFPDKPDCLKKIDEAREKASIEARRNLKPIPARIKLQEVPFPMADHCRVRPIPGYGGYVPAEPVECNAREPYVESWYKTTTQRHFGPLDYNVMGNSTLRKKFRRSQFAKLIRTVPPWNPFKNPEQRGKRFICYC